MKSVAIFITICIGLTAAKAVKRQATPPPPTLPPMKTDMVMDTGAPMGSNPTTQPPPPPSTNEMVTFPPQQPSASTDGGMTTMMVDTPTNGTNPPTPMSTNPPTNPPTDQNTTTQPIIVDTTTTQPPAPATTKKPTIDELVSVDEILEVFGNLPKSDFFKGLSYEDQLLVMEILTGGETGKMTPILEAVELKHLLTFMYNLPFKYADPLWRVIFLGYTREEMIAQ